MAFIQTSVPLVFWGKNPPSHEITCICKTEDKKGLATGSLTGQVCLWEICKERDTEKVKLRARCLLFGGKSAIIDMCFLRNWLGERDRIATLSSKGTLSLWDGKDGACLKFTNIDRKHCGIKSLPRVKYSDTLIALYGKYSEVYILDSETLDVLCHLQEAHSPNWVSQLCFLPNVEKKESVLVVNVDGLAKHWLLSSHSEMKDLKCIVEEKSQTLGLASPPLSLASYSYQNTHSTVLVVCKEAWQLYDATGGKMKLLMIHHCESTVSGWMKGDFLDHFTLIAWSNGDGRAFIYKLSASCVPGITESIHQDSTAGCSIQCVLGHPTPLTSSPSVYIDRYWHVQGDKNGGLYLWDMRKIISSSSFHDKTGSHSSIPYDTTCALADSWDPPALPSGLTDTLYPDSTSPIVTCAVYLTSLGRLVCGQADGSIAVLSALQAATVIMLQPRKFSRGWPKHCILRGHKGHVTCLIYPSSYSKAYNKDLLLSGGADFTVKLWSLFSGTHQHTFAVNGGKVRDIVSCPPDINPRLQTCVCSIAEDYSVAILSTSEKKCLLVASCHSSPVNTVHWRLDEDFLLVSCNDGRLYVWQIETGSLDRCVEGETARTILSTVLDTPHIISPSLQQTTTPLYVRSVSTGSNNPLIQILLFDPHQLILGLTKMEKLSKDVPKKKALKEADALRSYIYARRHFGSGGGPGGVAISKRPSLPSSSGSKSITTSFPSVGIDSSRLKERAREVLGQGVANQIKAENVPEESPNTIIDIIRLMLSCLHAWRLDEELDQNCEEILGLVQPSKPVSFGLLSKGGCMSLVLPGWGLRTRLQRLDSIQYSNLEKEGLSDVELSLESPPGGHEKPKVTYTFDQKYHLRWQCSRALTTQHLLTMVSITNTLMNQTIGAHHLATSSGMKQRQMNRDDDSDSDGDDNTVWDNQIRAVWSRVAALHCVMLPERMEGKFRPPYLPVLASRFLDPCQAIREAAQALLQAELRRIGVRGRKELVKEWATNLQTPTNTKWEGSKTRGVSDDIDWECGSGPTPTHQQQVTALIILGMIGAEFHEGDKTPHNRRKQHEQLLEVMDPGVARKTGKTLQRVLLERPHSKSTLHSNLRCSAAELLGRGFQLWEKYIDIPQVVMSLLDLVLQYSLRQSNNDGESNKKVMSSRSIKFTSEVARKALNLMIILRPVTMVTTLAKEVSSYLASQHVTHYPHSSVQPVQVGTNVPSNTGGIVTPPERLLLASKEEILDLMRTVIEKSQQKLTLQLLEVVDIVLFCLDQDSLKKKNVLDIFPSFSRIPNISYSSKSKRLAVGARNGQIGIYDLKQSRTQMLNAHTHPVTVLQFSDDGKLLATYAYADSILHVWQISSTMFGISQTPKLVNSWPAISSGAHSSAHSSFVRLEWVGSRTITLHMPGGVECKFSI